MCCGTARRSSRCYSACCSFPTSRLRAARRLTLPVCVLRPRHHPIRSHSRSACVLLAVCVLLARVRLAPWRTWGVHSGTTSSTSIRRRSGSGCKFCRTCSATPSPPSGKPRHSPATSRRPARPHLRSCTSRGSATASSTPATSSAAASGRRTRRRRRPPPPPRRRRARGSAMRRTTSRRGGAATAAATRKTAGRIGDGITQAAEKTGAAEQMRDLKKVGGRIGDGIFIGGVIGVIGGGRTLSRRPSREWSNSPMDELSGGAARGAGHGRGRGAPPLGSGSFGPIVCEERRRHHLGRHHAGGVVSRRLLRRLEIALRRRLLRRQASEGRRLQTAKVAES